MILGYDDIKEALDSGAWTCHRDGVRIGTDDLTINTNSCNLSLGNIILRPFINYDRDGQQCFIDLHDPESVKWREDQFTKLFLEPEDFALMHVRERFDCSAPLFIHGRDRYFAPMIEGRSTVARCGLSIHETAGWGEWKFSANFTIEVSTKLPIILRPGDEIGQIIFNEISSANHGYDSVYKEQFDKPKAPIIGKDRFRRHP